MKGRVLRRFEAQRIVARVGDRLRLLDPARLAAAADEPTP
jgi:hypothetical protein